MFLSAHAGSGSLGGGGVNHWMSWGYDNALNFVGVGRTVRRPVNAPNVPPRIRCQERVAGGVVVNGGAGAVRCSSY